MIKGMLQDRKDNDKCFICGKELDLKLENRTSIHSDNWRLINHPVFGTVKVHIKHSMA